MTQEEKYKEALERAMKLALTGNISALAAGEIFPELKEDNNDERIRKAIIAYIDHGQHNGVSNKDMIAWLEKQGEQLVEPNWCHHKVDLTNCSEEYRKAYYDGWNNCNMQHSQCKSTLEAWKDMRLEVYQQASGNRHEPNYSDDTTKMFSLNDIDEIIEKISEQKLADKVEPKFKVGDYVVGKYISGYISEIRNDCYLLDYQGFFIDKQDDYHLWTINDAKDGDLIYVSTGIKGIQAIFHKFENGIIYFHCNLCTDFTQGGYEPFDDIEFVSPLQKIHYQKFFQKMKEAGYVWNSEKKELKKNDGYKHGQEDIAISLEKKINRGFGTFCEKYWGKWVCFPL